MGLTEFLAELATKRMSKHQKVKNRASGVSQDKARKLHKRFAKAGNRGPRGY